MNVGDIYAVLLSDIRAIVKSTNGMNFCEYEGFDVNDTKMVLLKYLGNNKFIEFYSKKIINLIHLIDSGGNSIDFTEKYGDLAKLDLSEFMDIFNKYYSKPLIVDNESLKDIDLKIMKKIGENQGKENEIANEISDFESQAINFYQRDIFSDIMPIAYTENLMMDLAKDEFYPVDNKQKVKK